MPITGWVGLRPGWMFSSCFFHWARHICLRMFYTIIHSRNAGTCGPNALREIPLPGTVASRCYVQETNYGRSNFELGVEEIHSLFESKSQHIPVPHALFSSSCFVMHKKPEFCPELPTETLSDSRKFNPALTRRSVLYLSCPVTNTQTPSRLAPVGPIRQDEFDVYKDYRVASASVELTRMMCSKLLLHMFYGGQSLRMRKSN